LRSRTASAPRSSSRLLPNLYQLPADRVHIAGQRPQPGFSVAELESRYQAARKVWLSEADQIKACFGSATKWGNLPYNDDESMAALFDQLDTCFSESDTAFEALACLGDFCTSSLQENKWKKAKEPVPTHRFFGLCEEVRKAEQIWLAGLQLEFVEFARAELPRRKTERKIQYYDDLLTRLDDALSGPGGQSLAVDLQARYRAALIDEFQDTDRSSTRSSLRLLGGKTFLFLIGDPKQAIYGFRGADIFTYLEASDQASDRFTLGENWRSESGLVTAVNKIFSATPGSFVFERIGFQEVVAKGNADAEPLTLGGKKEPPFSSGSGDAATARISPRPLPPKRCHKWWPARSSGCSTATRRSASVG